MKKRGLIFRKTLNFSIKFLAVAASLAAALFLLWILFDVFQKGARSFNWSFFIEPTKPYFVSDGGIANAFLGTIFITFGAGVLSIPFGLLGGIYLSEFGRNSKFGNAIRFSANVMMGMPSIIVGIFVYTVLVYTTKHPSGFAGSVALAIIMFPVVLRTTEDMLMLVPNELRESALAIGTPRWKTTLGILFRAAKSGLITGILLSVARVSGETAPLLFTAMWSESWPVHFFSQPTCSLTVTIVQYANESPFEEMHVKAWGAALVVTVAVLFLNILCRIVFREKHR